MSASFTRRLVGSDDRTPVSAEDPGAMSGKDHLGRTAGQHTCFMVQPVVVFLSQGSGSWWETIDLLRACESYDRKCRSANVVQSQSQCFLHSEYRF